MLLFVAIWHLLVYCPIAHSNWTHGGFLNKAGVLDWAGGNVVHITAGVSGLVTSLVVGRRQGYGEKKFTPNNILHTITGACFLWVGWFGFNGGSSFAADEAATMSLLMTQIATSTAAFSWILMELIVKRQATVLGMINGSVAGLVSITPAAGYVDATGAFFIGLLSGPVCYYGSSLKRSLGFDDALDAFGLHGIAGIFGEIMTGLFATERGAKGAFYGNGYQLALQLYGVTCTAGWSLLMTFIILICINMTLGLRVSEATEKSGLDRSLHGEGLYAERSKTVTPSERVASLLKSYAFAKARGFDGSDNNDHHKNTNGIIDIQHILHNQADFRDCSISDDSSLTSSEICEEVLKTPLFRSRSDDFSEPKIFVSLHAKSGSSRGGALEGRISQRSLSLEEDCNYVNVRNDNNNNSGKYSNYDTNMINDNMMDNSNINNNNNSNSNINGYIHYHNNQNQDMKPFNCDILSSEEFNTSLSLNNNYRQ